MGYLSDMRVLITGISGFTGKYMRSSLERAGYEVFGSTTKLSNDPYVITADLRDLVSMRHLVEQVSPELVVHLAGVSNVAHGNLSDLYCSNIIGSRNLLHALAECKPTVKSVMMVSSGNVYGNTDSQLLSEKNLLEPINDYAVSKLAMESLCAIWSDRLPIFIVRPFNYTGDCQSENFLIPKIIKQYAEGSQSVSLGNLDVFREFNDVRQIVDVYKKLLEIRPTGKTINICSGKVYCLNDVINLMNDISGYEINVQIDHNFVRAKEIKCLRGDTTLLLNIIGPVDFKPLTETLSWMYNRRINDPIIN